MKLLICSLRIGSFLARVAFLLPVMAAHAITVTDTIPVGTSPSRASITPDGTEVYVSNMGSNTVSVIETATNTVTDTVPVCSQPDALAASPDGSRIFVGCHGGDVHQIDTATKAVSVIVTGAPVRDLAITPDGQKIYLAMEFSGLKKISTIDNSVSTVSGTVCPEAVVFTPDGLRAYVNYQCAPPPGGVGADPIYIFDATTDTKIGDISGFPNVGSWMAMAPDGSQLWANGANAIPSVGLVNVFQTSDDTHIQELQFADGAGKITIFPDSSLAAVGSGVGLLIFDTATFAVVETVNVDSSGNLAFTAGGVQAYTPAPAENSVKVLQIAHRLTLTPPSGAYLATQGFDLGLIVEALGVSVVGGSATLDGSDVTATLTSCLIPGTLIPDGLSFRCPLLSGDFLGEGDHTLSVTLDLSDGSSVGDTVEWTVIGNTEP